MEKTPKPPRPFLTTLDYDIEAEYCTKGLCWDYNLSYDPTTVILHFDNSGHDYSYPFEVRPYRLTDQIKSQIGSALLQYYDEWRLREKTNIQVCPYPADDDFDWEQEPYSFRTPEEEVRVTKWMMEGLSLIRLFHKRVRELMPELKKKGFRGLRVCWQPPAFDDSGESLDGDPDFWFPLDGPYLHIREMIESDTVPVKETRVHQVLLAHFPEIVCDDSNYALRRLPG
ncbi:hypothetical protein BJ508DRAFT_332669 [Ascobolus immersus RN42]|uniref:Uncharacterized protein n=1 Tax=Ascobolus immersus RN42 TaxID=1160509 RepID=A0A3N4HNG6_ASCIM|nr:hypothetical protein BJ508DRAFT_332669 [Ascobolus immersus RN42]